MEQEAKVTAFHQTKSRADDISLYIIFHSLLEKKRFIMSTMLFFFLFTIIYVLMKPQNYQAILLLQIQQNAHTQSSQIETVADEPLSVQIALIRSKFILLPVIYSFYNTKKSETELFNQILTHLTITDLSHSSDTNKISLLQLSLLGHDPILVTKILNQIAAVAQQKSIERKTLQIEKKLSFLKQQLPIIKQALQESESKLNQYRLTNEKIDIKLQTHALMSRLSDMDRELQEFRLKKENLLQQYTVEYPFVRLISAKIHELEKERLQIYSELKKIPVEDETSAAMERDIAVKNKLYMTILNQVHKLEVEKKGSISDVQVLLPATIPEKPLPVKLTMLSIVSIIVGLMMGCMLVLSWKIIQKCLHDPSKLPQRSRHTLPTIAQVVPKQP